MTQVSNKPASLPSFPF